MSGIVEYPLRAPMPTGILQHMGMGGTSAFTRPRCAGDSQGMGLPEGSHKLVAHPVVSPAMKPSSQPRKPFSTFSVDSLIGDSSRHKDTDTSKASQSPGIPCSSTPVAPIRICSPSSRTHTCSPSSRTHICSPDPASRTSTGSPASRTPTCSPSSRTPTGSPSSRTHNSSPVPTNRLTEGNPASPPHKHSPFTVDGLLGKDANPTTTTAQPTTGVFTHPYLQANAETNKWQKTGIAFPPWLPSPTFTTPPRKCTMCSCM